MNELAYYKGYMEKEAGIKDTVKGAWETLKGSKVKAAKREWRRAAERIVDPISDFGKNKNVKDFFKHKARTGSSLGFDGRKRKAVFRRLDKMVPDQLGAEIKFNNLDEMAEAANKWKQIAQAEAKSTNLARALAATGVGAAGLGGVATYQALKDK